MKNILAGAFLLFVCLLPAAAQKSVVDEIVAVVGSEIILRSELEQQAQQVVLQGGATVKDDALVCEILEDMVYQKLMINQAELDSMQVGEDQVESELERRIDYFIQQIGSREKLEAYLGKSLDELKKDFRKTIRDQLLVQQMQQKITGTVKVTPSEVKDFYHSIPKDSLPYIPSEVQIGQIVLEPKIRKEEKDRIIRELNAIRDQILAGSKFSLKAITRSEDLGSANNGGELGFFRREELVPEFSAAGFSLQNTEEVSEVVESEFGFHIIQLIEKRGELANFRHILIKPKVSSSDISLAEYRLDSIVRVINRNDTISFKRAAELFSMDGETKNNGGLLINPTNGGTKFAMEELDAPTFLVIDRLEVGGISAPHVFDRGGKKAVRVLFLMTKTEPHVADLRTDYQRIMMAALQNKQNQAMTRWVAGKLGDIYVKIDPAFKDCRFENDWFSNKNQ